VRGWDVSAAAVGSSPDFWNLAQTVLLAASPAITVDGRRVRFLVALARCGDLLLRAKHLLVAAIGRWMRNVVLHSGTE
jgi:hypothetical protein